MQLPKYGAEHMRRWLILGSLLLVAVTYGCSAQSPKPTPAREPTRQYHQISGRMDCKKMHSTFNGEDEFRKRLEKEVWDARSKSPYPISPLILYHKEETPWKFEYGTGIFLPIEMLEPEIEGNVDAAKRKLEDVCDKWAL